MRRIFKYTFRTITKNWIAFNSKCNTNGLLAKNVLITLRLTGAASATEAEIHKKMFRSGTTTLIISNEEINVIMKIVKSLEKSGLLIKPVSEAIKNEAKEQRV